MKHKCEKWLDEWGICEKCNRPEWSLWFKNPFKVGDDVRLPFNYTYGGKLFKIIKELKDGSYRLQRYDLHELLPIPNYILESYWWWELRPINEAKP